MQTTNEQTNGIIIYKSLNIWQFYSFGKKNYIDGQIVDNTNHRLTLFNTLNYKWVNRTWSIL